MLEFKIDTFYTDGIVFTSNVVVVLKKSMLYNCSYRSTMVQYVICNKVEIDWHDDVSSNVVFSVKTEDCKLLPYNQVCAEIPWRVQYVSIALIHFQDCLCILEIVMLQYIFCKWLIFVIKDFFFNKSICILTCIFYCCI